MYNVYPKSLLKLRLPSRRNRCFVLMPFSTTFDEVYSEIKAAMARISFQCIRADDIYSNTPIMSIIISELATSHFIVADLTERNPNVFYEVGIAHSFRDMSNVVLISQSMDFVPFDLRHLPIILYDRDNLRGLTARLTKRILENKGYFEGQILLREKYRSQVATESELDEILDFLEGQQDRSIWRLILHMFGVDEEQMHEGEIASNIFLMRRELASILGSGNLRLFKSLMRIYRDILCHYVDIEQVNSYVSDALRQKRFSDFSLDDAEMTSVVIDLAITLFKHPRFKRRSLEWLFDYLSRPKVAGIDLNRSKVEHFVMYCQDPEVREALVYTLESQNSYMRETAADFIGEMRLTGAARNLLFALSKETSPFASRSMFAALEKMSELDGGPSILAWMGNNVEAIRSQKLDYVTRHAERALSAIDRKHGTNFIAELKKLEL